MAAIIPDRSDPDVDYPAIYVHIPTSGTGSMDLTRYTLNSMTIRLHRDLPPAAPYTPPHPPPPTDASLRIASSPPAVPESTQPAPYTIPTPSPAPHSSWCLLRHHCLCSARHHTPAAAPEPADCIFITPKCAEGDTGQTYMIPLYVAPVLVEPPPLPMRRPGAGAVVRGGDGEEWLLPWWRPVVSVVAWGMFAWCVCVVYYLVVCVLWFLVACAG